MRLPLVTIGIPVKNAEKTINEAIDCILRQTYPAESVEVIVNDDGCTDNTLTLIKAKLAQSNIKSYYLKTIGKGLGAARQTILNNAHGKYVAWVDGDILLFPNFLMVEIDHLERNPAVWQVRGKWEPYPPENLAEELENISLIRYESDHKDASIARDKLVGLGGSVCRTDLMKKVGFDKKITGAGEDIDIAAQLIGAGWVTDFANAKFYHKSGLNWSILWKKYFWYGYGSHYVKHKSPKLIKTWTRLPPFAFISGILKAFTAFKVLKKIKCFLLPFEYVFKQTAWCYGFITAHIKRYNQ